MSTALRTYWRGATLAAMQDHVAGVTRTYHLDHQGTVQCLTDDNGVVTDRFACDTWGNEFKRTGTSINRHWYIGHLGYYRQVDQALDYVRARWLAPRPARWIGPDRYSTTHSYPYADSSPAIAVDPTGWEASRPAAPATSLLPLLCRNGPRGQPGCQSRSDTYCCMADSLSRFNRGISCFCHVSSTLCAHIGTYCDAFKRLRNFFGDIEIQRGGAYTLALLGPCVGFMECGNKCLYDCFEDVRKCDPKSAACWRSLPSHCRNASELRNNPIQQDLCCRKEIECEQTRLTWCLAAGGCKLPPLWEPCFVGMWLNFPFDKGEEPRIAHGRKLCCEGSAGR